jgi:hypothetical protein
MTVPSWPITSDDVGVTRQGATGAGVAGLRSPRPALPARPRLGVNGELVEGEHPLRVPVEDLHHNRRQQRTTLTMPDPHHRLWTSNRAKDPGQGTNRRTKVPADSLQHDAI